MPHNCNALTNVVCTIALHLGTRTIAVGDFAHYLKFAGVVVELGLYVSESVDAGDNLRSVLSETVKDATERLLANFVCLCSNLDCSLGSSKRLVSCEECEAFCLLAKKHCSEVSVTKTNLAVVSYRTRDAECLETETDCLSSLSSVLATFLESDCRADNISPLRVLEADWLGVFAGLVRIETVLVAERVGLFNILYAVFVEDSKYLFDTTILAFELNFSYNCIFSLFFTWINIFDCTCLLGEAAV